MNNLAPALLVILIALALSAAACGQRVYPKAPEGKIDASRAY